jgi:hypothetical protein
MNPEKPMKLDIRIRLAALCILILPLSPHPAVAVAPATQSATDPSPRQTVEYWNKAAETWTVEQAMQIYYFSDENSKRFSQEMAIQLIPLERLQKGVREKWGFDAEQNICRVCGSDSIQDDQAATETLQGDHVVVRFKDDVCVPLPMIKVNGIWKLDEPTFVRGLGDTLPTAETNVKAATSILQQALADFEAGKFTSVDDLARSLDKSFDALAPLAPLDFDKKK